MVYNFNVKFYNGPVTIDTIQNEYLLLYVIRGSCHVHLASETLHMNPKDVLMIVRKGIGTFAGRISCEYRVQSKRGREPWYT